MQLKRPHMSNRSGARGVVVAILAILACGSLVACSAVSDPTTSSGPEVGSSTTSVSPPVVDGGAIATTTSTTLSDSPGTMGAVSVFDAPEFHEYGAWWLIPNATLVVRGTLGEPVDSIVAPGAGGTLEVWDLSVDETLLGVAPGSDLHVGRSVVDDSTLWRPGLSGIFALVPLPIGSTVSGSYWILPFGSGGVITDDLDSVATAFREASPALGVIWVPNHVDTDAVVSALNTDAVVEATVSSIADAGSSLDVRLSRVALTDVETVWLPHLSGYELGTDVVDESADFSEIQLPTEWLEGAGVGSRLRLYLTIRPFPGRSEAAWTPVDAEFGIRTASAGGTDVESEMDALTAQREGRLVDLRVSAEASLQAPFSEYGRIPLHDDSNAAPQSPDLSLVQRQPLIADSDGVTVVFDNWFMVLFDPSANVEVLDDAGHTLAEGPIMGEGAIVRNAPDGSIEILGPDGTVVATVTQDELRAAMDRAIQQASSDSD